MQLVSVNVGVPREIDYRGKKISTGIYKEPVSGAAMLRTLNLDGDGQADLENHGGRDKAVYVYPAEHYSTWAEELDMAPFPYGYFGENFTVSGMREDRVCIGDVFRVGGALVQVTQPRIPCFKLEHKIGVEDFARRFSESLRVGFYLRVLEEGPVTAGDSIEGVSTGPEQMSVQAIYHLRTFDRGNATAARRALNIPALPEYWRRKFTQIIERYAG